MYRPRWLYTPGAGFLFALCLLGIFEVWLHTDAFLHTYRSVFAVGRADDKIRYVETHVPAVLIIGNSRVDNAFDPATTQSRLHGVPPGQVFNLGMPGADARILYGVLQRLADKGLLGPGRIRDVVIGLDENLLLESDGLGYGVFFASRTAMWQQRELTDLIRSTIRLWGFSGNLKELREPAKLQQFVRASLREVEPLGGGAGEHLGYRAGFGGLQDAGAAMAQDAGSKDPPSDRQLGYFWRSFDLLAAHHVATAVVFPPLLNRDVLYLSPRDPAAAPYLAIAADLRARGVPLIALDPGGRRSPDEFVNAGHLNDKGAQRFSSLLGERLADIWPDGTRGVTP